MAMSINAFSEPSAASGHAIAVMPGLGMQLSTGTTAEPVSGKVLMLVLLAHILIFAALMQVHDEAAEADQPVTPMMVSLVTESRPAPEVVPLMPEPLRPLVKKVVHKSVEPQESKPTPQPEMQQNLPPPPAAITETHAEPAPAPEPVKMPEVVEPPKPESIPEITSGIAFARQVTPDYPSLSRRLREQGTVMLRLLVTEWGHVESVEIRQSSGFTRLDEAAIKAAQQSEFVPYQKNHRPSSAYVLVPYRFNLN